MQLVHYAYQGPGGTAVGTPVAGAVLRTALGPERATAVAREGRLGTG